MKRFLCAILALLLFLTGCQSPAPEVTEPSEGPTQTTEPQPADTEPVQTLPQEPTETEPVETTPVFDPYAIIDTMSTEELVGQLFLARCPGKGTAAADAQTYHLGGYVLFGGDTKYETPDSLRQTIQSYQDAASIPLLIAVDEEGGTVNRVSSNKAFRSSRFQSPRKLYSQGGLGLLTSTEAEKSQLLSSLGINVNLAPVCDITTNKNAFMYDRSLGLSPDDTGKCIAAMVMVQHRNGIGSVLKHFPGYGNNTDTHVGIAVDERSLDELGAVDLVPFAYGIRMNCDAIMVSHTIVKCLDDQLPASLSPAVVDYMRNTMGFEGVIVTDDLIMQAITKRYGDDEAAVMAVLAGIDMLCSSSYKVQYEAVLEAVNSGRIPAEQVKASVARILQWKYRLGLLEIPA